MTMFVDQNGINDFVDQNGASLFRDQNNIFLGLGGVLNNVTYGDRVLDNGLTVLTNECTAFWLCNASPSTYAEALSFKLAQKVGSIFDTPTASANGRSVATFTITNGNCVSNGIVSYWAAVDTGNTLLLASGPVSTNGTVSNGQLFSLSSFTLEIARSPIS